MRQPNPITARMNAMLRLVDISPEARIRALDAALIDVEQRGVITVASWNAMHPRDRAMLYTLSPYLPSTIVCPVRV
jgi:hypothetical protein